MSKVIRLTESQLKQIVNDVIKEQQIIMSKYFIDEQNDDGSESPERIEKYHSDIEKIEKVVNWMYDHVHDFYNISDEDLKYFNRDEMFRHLEDEYGGIDETQENFNVVNWAKKHIRNVFQEMEDSN